MKNGLYSVHTYLLDGVKGRSSGIIIIRDGTILAGDPHSWSVGTYTVGNGTWKGDLVTNQHTPIATVRSARSSMAAKSPRVFRARIRMTIPRFSGPR